MSGGLGDAGRDSRRSWGEQRRRHCRRGGGVTVARSQPRRAAAAAGAGGAMVGRRRWAEARSCGRSQGHAVAAANGGCTGAAQGNSTSEEEVDTRSVRSTLVDKQVDSQGLPSKLLKNKCQSVIPSSHPLIPSKRKWGSRPSSGESREVLKEE
ncbi:hypothetical protein Taro_012356 [Colocasia esculenta]|uniref:Uncharacterized protein n=1 Tax=Colocasia esculenta TaxID=4460 RepID=A0A843UFE0_COLES|nr:hypothetical protein [Colocasia esculenta]